MPVPGDKLICYRNGQAPQTRDPEKYSTIINGSLWSVITADKCQTEDADERLFMLLTLKSLDNPNTPNITVRTPREYFWLTHPDHAAKEDGGWHIFTFGYAITCHKAQGSEWNNVLIFDHSWGDTFKPYQWKWLYTATTRAAFQTTVIRGPWT